MCQNNKLENIKATAILLNKKLDFVDTQNGDIEPFLIGEIDPDFVDATIKDTLINVKSTIIKDALQFLLEEGTYEEKLRLLLDNDSYPPNEVFLKKKNTGDFQQLGIVSEVVCFTICYTTGIGGIAHPGGTDEFSDKCYERCKTVRV